jgi:Ca2+-binding EF-hand superfamily protein
LENLDDTFYAVYELFVVVHEFFLAVNSELCIQFAQFDKDGDGVISSTELCQVMNSLGLVVSLDAIQKVLRRASLDGK